MESLPELTMLLSGGIGLVLIIAISVFTLLLFILWIILPFAIIGTKDILRENVYVLKEIRSVLRENLNCQKDILKELKVNEDGPNNSLDFDFSPSRLKDEAQDE